MMLFLRFGLPKMLEGRDRLSLVRGVLRLDRGVPGMRETRGSGVLEVDFASRDSALICS
jgi:hypothetical protein